MKDSDFEFMIDNQEQLDNLLYSFGLKDILDKSNDEYDSYNESYIILIKALNKIKRTYK